MSTNKCQIDVTEILFTVETSAKQDKSIWYGFQNQCETGKYCDIIIKCKERTFYAHKNILSSASKYFETMFTSLLMSEQKESIAKFNTFQEETVDISLHLLYHKEISRNEENRSKYRNADIVDILKFAEYVQSDWLLDTLVTAIRKRIYKDNAQIWYDIGIESGVEKIKSIAYCHIRNHGMKLGEMCENDDNNEIMFNKEVVLFLSSVDNIFHLFDSEDRIFTEYEGDIALLAANNRDIDVHLVCMHENDCYVVSSFKPAYRLRDIVIQKYDYYTKKFITLHSIAVTRMFPTEEHEPGLHISSMVYDDSGYFYFLLIRGCGKLVYKYRIKEKILCKNYISIDDPEDSLSFLTCRLNGTLLFQDFETIYHVKEFDFDNLSGYSPMDHEGKIIDLAVMNQEYFDGHMYFKTVSVNGNIYMIGDSDEGKVLTVFFLDMGQLSVWKKLCHFNVNHASDSNPFSLQGRLCVAMTGKSVCLGNIQCFTDEGLSPHTCHYYEEDCNDTTIVLEIDLETPVMRKIATLDPCLDYPVTAMCLPSYIFL